MKLLISAFFTLLLTGLAGSSHGQDFEEIKRLAGQGVAEAQNSLGVMYDNGRGVPESDAEAVKWFRLAAEQGTESAQFAL